MRRMNLILGVILVAQLILAVVLASTGGGNTPATRGPLLALDEASVDTIVITAGDQKSVKLVKRDDGWQVPAKSGFPAAKQQVSNLLDSLQQMQPRLPVATSTAARERFRVGKRKFARRITLKADGNTVATVYFGESAGPGEVYARLAGSSAIYEVRFELWTATADAGGWLDSTYLHRTTAELARVELPDMTLEHKANAWQLADLAADKSTAVNKAAAIVSDLTTVAFEAVVGRKQAMDLPEPTFSYTLVTDGGDQVRYRFRKRPASADDGGGKQGDNSGGRTPAWLLTTSDSDYVFRVSDNEVSRLRDNKRSKLVMVVDDRNKSDKAKSQMAGTAGTGSNKDKA